MSILITESKIENQTLSTQLKTEIIAFGLIVKMYCPKHVELEINQIVARIIERSATFASVSMKVSNVLGNYSLPYKSWLKIINRNPSPTEENEIPQFSIICQIVETFIVANESRTAIFTYFSIVVHCIQNRNPTFILLQEVLKLLTKLNGNVCSSRILKLTAELIKFIPPFNDFETEPHLHATEEDLYKKEFPSPSAIREMHTKRTRKKRRPIRLKKRKNNNNNINNNNDNINNNSSNKKSNPKNISCNNKNNNKNNKKNYDDDNNDNDNNNNNENSQGEIFGENISYSYSKSDDIVPCQGFPFHVSNNSFLVNEVKYEDIENTSFSYDDSLLRYIIFYLMEERFEGVEIADNLCDAVLSFGRKPGVRQRILFKSLYGKKWKQFEEMIKKHPKATTASMTITKRCTLSMANVLKSQLHAALELESFLRHIPPFESDVRGFHTFSMEKEPFSMKFTPTDEACAIIRQIINDLSDMPWFLKHVIHKIHLSSFIGKVHSSFISGNKIANAINLYCQCLSLLFEFLPIEKSPEDKAANNKNDVNSVDSFYEDNNEFESFPQIDTNFDDFNNDKNNQNHNQNNETENDNDNDNDNIPHYPQSLESNIENNTDYFFTSKEDDIYIPPDIGNEERYYSPIEDMAFSFSRRYKINFENTHIPFTKQFIHMLTQRSNIDKMIIRAEDRFGEKTKFFLLFCNCANRLSEIASAILLSNEWKLTMELFKKYGNYESIESNNNEINNFPNYLFEARVCFPFSLVRIEYSSDHDEVTFYPLG